MNAAAIKHPVRASQKPLNPSARASKDEQITRPELRELLAKTQNAVRRIPWWFNGIVAASFCGLSIVFGAAWFALGRFLFPTIWAFLLIWAVVVPSLLLAGAISHSVGNWVLRRFSGLSDTERRCLALHLPWERTPSYWPAYLRKWIYCGDWLVDNFHGDLMPYVRAFVTGPAPTSLEEELSIWTEVMRQSRSRCSLDLEVGHSIRELACVESLPAWTRDISPGMNLPDLQSTLGNTGRQWALTLLKRAATRKAIFNLVDLDGPLKEVTFEFHHCATRNGREALMVILRPRLRFNSTQRPADIHSDLAA